MELFAVICIQTSHYVSFSKWGGGKDAQWVFFDSMADREGGEKGFNIPQVSVCEELQSCFSDELVETEIKNKTNKELKERLRRFICDGYFCFYNIPDDEMFG
ncbi:hypothetical protein ScPMuIL_001916 [Solemya velum]